MKQRIDVHSTREIGNMGEDIAEQYLLRNGYNVIQRNYWRKWGELDLIVKKDHMIVFVEVKTVSYETKSDLDRAVTHGTWRPEENVHYHKIQRMNRAIESWIMEHEYEGEWQIDVAAVRVVPREKYATIKLIKNVIFG